MKREREDQQLMTGRKEGRKEGERERGKGRERKGSKVRWGKADVCIKPFLCATKTSEQIHKIMANRDMH